MLQIIFAVIVFLLTLGVIVIVHEAGHFIFAKKAGVLCHEFSIGMGPIVAQKKKGETAYSIRAIPIGGFVAMAGEDMNEQLIRLESKIGLNLEKGLVKDFVLTDKVDAELYGTVKRYDLYSKQGAGLFIELETESGKLEYFAVAEEAFYIMSAKQKVQVAPYDRCFESKTKTQRTLSIAAGPMMNFILALFLFIIVGLVSGIPNMDSTTIKKVSKGYKAAEILKAGDEITQVNGVQVDSWTAFQTQMLAFRDQGADVEKVELVIMRDGKEFTFIIPTMIGINSIGLSNLDAKENTQGKGIVIGKIPSGNKAAEAGLKKNDILYQVDVLNKAGTNKKAHPIQSWTELVQLFQTLDLTNDRLILHYLAATDGYKEKETKLIEPFTLDTLTNAIHAKPIDITIGVSPTTNFHLIKGIGNGFRLLWSNVKNIFITLGMVLGFTKNSQVSVSDLSGPVGIFQLVRSYLTTDLITYIAFVGMLSVNIGIFNLLPIPALDGGRLVFIGYEAITKRPVNKKLETVLNNVVFILLMILFVFVTYRDILRLR